MTFRLTLTAAPLTTASFGLYIQTDPASIGQDLFPFCGPGPYEVRLCTSQQSFDREFGPFDPGTILVYRFELYPQDASEGAQVISSGRHVADGSVVEVKYP